MRIEFLIKIGEYAKKIAILLDHALVCGQLVSSLLLALSLISFLLNVFLEKN
jgi:hypothetical protein